MRFQSKEDAAGMVKNMLAAEGIKAPEMPDYNKIPRKGGPGITRSDLLVINKIDLAPLVGADLDVMDHDARQMRGDKPYYFSNLKENIGLQEIIEFVENLGGLRD